MLEVRGKDDKDLVMSTSKPKAKTNRAVRETR
jgi:hypothetical protein